MADKKFFAFVTHLRRTLPMRASCQGARMNYKCPWHVSECGDLTQQGVRRMAARHVEEFPFHTVCVDIVDRTTYRHKDS